ncbi:hypothetical protein D4764_20G0008400 [Takifugu flavidus]|uniref:Uncharacterized protein n=1 Tax=Takifugu flavidus TaxID=433684 RepID=A0A5C6NJ90_9TELE|nr:hypothetical protein D4764_20G0008400 [Takifugu flavidus]
MAEPVMTAGIRRLGAAVMLIPLAPSRHQNPPVIVPVLRHVEVVFSRLSGSGSVGQQLQEGCPDSPSAATSIARLGGPPSRSQARREIGPRSRPGHSGGVVKGFIYREGEHTLTTETVLLDRRGSGGSVRPSQSSRTGEDSGVWCDTLTTRTCPETLKAEAVLLGCQGSMGGPPGDQEQERPSRETGSSGTGATLQGNRNTGTGAVLQGNQKHGNRSNPPGKHRAPTYDRGSDQTASP